MRDDYGVDPEMYNQQTKQAKYHKKVPIHFFYDELNRSQGMGMDNENHTGCTRNLVSDSKAHLHILQCELEEAMDDHLVLLQENKSLKESTCEKRVTAIDLEYMDLSAEYESLLADVERKRKEVNACKRIIHILQGEITKEIELQTVVDLTQYPDYY